MPSDHQQPTDMRRYRRRTERQLLAAVLFMLVVVGSVLIGLIYGWRNVITAVLCLVPGALIIVLLWLLLRGVEYLTRDSDS
jgi:O-antigen/teichoic acid export membrane protein